MKNNKLILITLIVLILISGCAAVKKEVPGAVLPRGMSEQPVLQPEYASQPPSEGSLWTELSAPLFEDTKARCPGDTLVVDIVENSSSSMDVNTETSRDSSMDIGVPNFFGYMRQFEALSNPTSKGMLGDKLVGTKYKNDFTGEATSDRTGQITASIAARIIEVLPNGNLGIFGKRAMKVNSEVQYIVVSGIVRPQDISCDNRVKSTYLADSSIEYFGKGALADKQKPGWGTRFFDNVWPF
ncbi:MAG: flagellar basal body L-ring protein FlgH [Thermodesulfobacteriota bacterium]|nr:flagellar basal body L-ring protein FlgH [Thermodesulfobacteriota bacterium]